LIGHGRDWQTPLQDAWTWIVIGLAFGTVVVALHDPLVWVLTHSV
jgi:hypothetical protein